MNLIEELSKALEEFAIPTTQEVFDHLEQVPEGMVFTSDQGFVEISRSVH